VELAPRDALLADKVGIVLAERTPPVEAGLGMYGAIEVDGVGVLRGGIDGHATGAAGQLRPVDLAAHWLCLGPDLDAVNVHALGIVAAALQQAAALGAVEPQFGQVGVGVAHSLEGRAALRESVLDAVETRRAGLVRQVVAAGGLGRGEQGPMVVAAAAVVARRRQAQQENRQGGRLGFGLGIAVGRQ
jgi:hypothetical protein